MITEMATQPTEITVEFLETQIRRAAYCERVTLPGAHFRAIFDLARRVEAFDRSNLSHLANATDRAEVRLTGREIRAILILAFEAKRKNLPHRLKEVGK